MATLLPPELARLIEELVEDLAVGCLAELERRGCLEGVPADDLRRRILEYGRTVVALPRGWQERADAVTRRSAALAVDVDLWTAEEGPSDLTLSLECVPGGRGWTLSVEDLRVL